MLRTDCIACQYGQHEHHIEVTQPVAEGVMGGAMCPCKGECRDRPQPPIGVLRDSDPTNIEQAARLRKLFDSVSGEGGEEG